jgi:hypothetical protein
MLDPPEMDGILSRPDPATDAGGYFFSDGARNFCPSGTFYSFPKFILGCYSLTSSYFFCESS